MSTFQEDLTSLINRHSAENGSNTPDFILAKYLGGCLDAFNAAVSDRERWYERDPATATLGGVVPGGASYAG